ncbi:uncharacterized protein LOC111462109 [Cucurbita moschata]|uniref:Uncharacterized protein LOC111462109 n=1 Tax=Cucurbita moschata TaxID=3662 RepID=A0A6J1HAQ3_CUCMO|nr:uncharacterized protein LOC111462109 [Cucurbita moschata]
MIFSLLFLYKRLIHRKTNSLGPRLHPFKELHSSKVDDSCVTPSHIGDKSDKNHHFVPLPSTIKHAPKKIVSIKETVEDIDSIMKERRKNKGTKKSKSFDFDNEYDGSLKPTRSILKVGSLNDKSDLLNSLNRVE